ncbi:MAG: AAA family ATPase [Chloroflexi bacterium]|nr:AAA family ATPase [Chloroflexota bacterium]
MTTTIAVAGKGGTGKTTIAALIVRHLKENNLGSVLAIDADPSSNLNVALGLPLDGTVGDIREEMLGKVSAGAMTPGLSKQDYLEYKLNEIMVESSGVDLMAMGRPEGAGCYCAANNMLRTLLDRLGKEYDFVVMDNEAGLEHLSRRTTRDVDVMLIVSDPTIRGMMAARRVVELIDELKTHVGRAYLIINRLDNGLTVALQQAVDALNIPLVGTISRDVALAELDANGRPLTELPVASSVYKAVKDILQRTGIN